MLDYENMNCDELRAKAKEWKVIRYSHDRRLKRDELIAQLKSKEMVLELTRSKQMAESGYIKKKAYLDTAKIGTLVAFKTADERAKSAKIIGRSTADKKLEVETEYGAKAIIDYDDVLWIKTGSRWPKGIYNLLKGYSESEEKK